MRPVDQCHLHTHTHAITKLFFQLCLCYFEVTEDISEKKNLLSNLGVVSFQKIVLWNGMLAP